MRRNVSTVMLLLVICVGIFIFLQMRGATSVNNKAVTLIETGNYREAITMLRKGIEDYPDQATLYKNLGVAYKAIGENDFARAVFGKYLYMRPNDSEVIGHLQSMRETVKKEETDKEIRLRAKARVKELESEGWPDDGTPISELMMSAEALAKRQRYDMALGFYERALLKTPEDMDLVRKIEELEKKLKPGR